MNIQSLSICVPAGCKNNCKFCVAGMEEEIYEDRISSMKADVIEEYEKRMDFARDNGCNTCVLTGNGEPIENKEFLHMFKNLNNRLDTPFRWIELQTSGVDVDLEDLKFLKRIGVSVISLSLSSIFSDEKNAEYNGTPKGLEVDIENFCSMVKDMGFVLRLSLNMTDVYNKYNSHNYMEIFDYAKELGANQVTLRELYTSGWNLKQDRWINKHRIRPDVIEAIRFGIEEDGEKMDILPYGFIKYSLKGLSIVIDNDCMSEDMKSEFKYLILRPDCKLYTKWDKKESVLF